MNKIYTNHPDVKKIALSAYPNYNGKKFSVSVTDNPIDTRSSWEGGSRDYFVFLRLDNLSTFEIPSQSAFDAKIKGAEGVSLVNDMVCVRHTFFCGKDLGITVYVHSSNAPAFIEEKKELTIDEKIVLVYTRSYKNSYGGKSNVRFSEANRSKGISSNEWQIAVKSLQDKGMLNKALAITNEGRNAIGDTKEYSL